MRIERNDDQLNEILGVWKIERFLRHNKFAVFRGIIKIIENTLSPLGDDARGRRLALIRFCFP